MSYIRLRPLLAAGTLLGVTARGLQAQARGRELSVAVGVMQFDGIAYGTEPTVAARVAAPVLSRWLLTELNATYAALSDERSLAPTHTGFLEGQVQLQLPLAHFRPYIGFGGGWVRYFDDTPGRATTSRSLSGSAGARIALSGRVGLRSELRLRGWVRTRSGGFGFVNSAAEYTGGLTNAF